MSDRAQKMMDSVWNERNTWANTEQKLVAAIIRKSIEYCKTLTASKLDNLSVIDKNDMLQLSKEIENIK
jgi:hypothetical protein